MEGPSLRLAAEQLKPFVQKSVTQVSGNTKIGKERLLGLKVNDIFSWGKHLIFQMPGFALRVHFLLWGTFAAEVEKKSVTGDYQRSGPPRLILAFPNGSITMHSCSLKYLEEKNARKIYDFSVDVMSDQWDEKKALKDLKEKKEEQIADALLDQDAFAGVGNIIKNEVLHIAKVHPEAKVGDIPPRKLKEIVGLARSYSFDFLKWRRKFELKKHYQVYRQSACKTCGSRVRKKRTGVRQRFSFICPACQGS